MNDLFPEIKPKLRPALDDDEPKVRKPRGKTQKRELGRFGHANGEINVTLSNDQTVTFRIVGSRKARPYTSSLEHIYDLLIGQQVMNLEEK